MRARLLHLAAVQHDDAVGVADGGQAVGDHERGAALHQVRERLLHEPLGFGVERRGGLVEDQDRRVLEEARAMAMRWRWPPDRRLPRSPITVS